MRGRGRGATIPLAATDPSPVDTYLARLSPVTRPTKRWEISVIAKELGGTPTSAAWHTLTYQRTVLAFSRIDALPLSLTTKRHLRGTLRAVLRECWRAGLMSADAMMRASDLPQVQGKPPPAGRALTDDQVRQLLARFPRTPSGYRDRAILVLALSTGLRREEMLSLAVADYDPATGRLLVRAGKGHKPRYATVAALGSRQAIDAWLAIRGPQPGPMMCPVDRWDHPRPAKRMSGVRLAQIVRGWGQAIGLTLTTHDLRRTAVTWLLDAGIDPDSVRQFAGHANIQTTIGYRRTQRDLAAEAAAHITLPL